MSSPSSGAEVMVARLAREPAEVGERASEYGDVEVSIIGAKGQSCAV